MSAAVTGIDRYSLDRGLDSVTRTSRPEVPLPDAAHLPPAEQLNRPEIDNVLHQPNLKEFVANQLRPEIADRQLLTPQRFERTLRQAAQSMRDLSSTDNGRPPSPALSKAARALTEEANLRELLSMYRSTLYQG
jgi:type III secretion protein X